MTQPVNALTIDVEDWFHILDVEGAPSVGDWTSLESRVERNLDRLLGIAEAAGVRATCFFLGWVLEHHPGAAERAAAGGHEIATHGYGHELVWKLGPEGFRSDLEHALEVTDKRLGVTPAGYRAPGFSITPDTPWALDTIGDLGMQYDSSIFPTQRAHGGWEDAPLLPHEIELATGGTLTEFPISLTSVLGRRVAYCGGGYLRLFPHRFIRSRIAQANARGESVNIYVHPRDIDPDQPRIPMPAARRFKSYVNLDSAADKLRRLLDEFPFSTMSHALGSA
jgi:polysaccharide deacetylase family protein (PEP-CTERM system associated)